MYRGLHPLLIHLGIAASNTVGMQQYAGAIGSPKYSHDEMVETVRGIQMYQEHSYIPDKMNYDVIYQNGKVRVLKPAHTKPLNNRGSAPVLLVPSLINKSSILDISEDMSLLRWLYHQGLAAYLLDWGDLNPQDAKSLTMSDIVLDALLNGIDALSELHSSPVDLIGYCMGGILCAGVCSVKPDIIDKMVLLATPWDFHDKSNIFAKNVRIWSHYVEPIMTDKGHIPSEWIQALFAGYDPDGSVQKFARFASMDQNSSQAHTFISVEDWLNDGVDLPADIARHCMHAWFRDNALLNNSWQIDAHELDLTTINNDILIVSSDKDRLVPLSSAQAAIHTLKNAKIEMLKKSSGHIGLIVGKKAVSEVWEPIFKWLQKV